MPCHLQQGIFLSKVCALNKYSILLILNLGGCMENLKKGDLVSLVNDKVIRISSEHKFRVTSVRGKYISINSFIDINKNEVFKIGESQMKYEESNRYKLAQAVKEKVKLIKSKEIYATAEILSLATGNSKTYFSTQTAKSKFLSRGDLSEKTYQEMLTDLAFAEREVLGIGAKTVEGELYTAVVDNKGDVVDIVKTGTVEDTPVEATHYMEFANGEVQYFKADESIEEKPISNKPLFIGASVVIFIVLILFILNNYLQVV